ncbi:T9SS type A sorting domain-containing protein [Flavicella sp.]|uniref:T9SS type A sorting domain-containing protein n=1 Tax=Flavicella sp. TaxID=2957742 RepID=UPI002631585F|nr:T9SS type A sorting domain-containing protein [Flavicella sp.]MDG1804406.1 T9SS type A sorting domain-containing protein [Flavicella sp.]
MKSIGFKFDARKIHIVKYFFSLLFFSLINNVISQNLVFEKQLESDNPLENIDLGSGVSSVPVDIDFDDDYDLFIGTSEGKILFYKNVSTNDQPDLFEEQIEDANPLSAIKLGSKASPFFVDIDNDDDLDLFIGYTNGVAYYENTGSNLVANYEEKVGVLNPLSEVTHAGARSYAPTFVDADKDDDLDVFIGWLDTNVADSQGILYYKNSGDKDVPTFENEIALNPFKDFNELYPTPLFVDADGDGDQDVFIGKGDGKMDYYKNTTDYESLDTEEFLTSSFAPYPNPASGQVNFSGLKEDTEIKIYNLYGQVVIQKVVSPEQNSIDVSHIKTGIYMLVSKIEDQKISKRLVITN